VNTWVVQHSVFRGLLTWVWLISATVATAQADDQLYDPVPPEDSAYLRIINASHDGAVSTWVDGKLRGKSLAIGEAGDYLVVPMGKHKIIVQVADKPTLKVAVNLVADRGHSMTMAVTSLHPAGQPLIFEDKINANKLKAVLAIYHLAPSLGSLDVESADGKVKVFANLASGVTNQLLVNPISIELIAMKSGEKAELARAGLVMQHGSAYSLLVLKNENGKPILRVVENKIERYNKH